MSVIELGVSILMRYWPRVYNWMGIRCWFITVIFPLSSGLSDRYLTVSIWFVCCRIGKLIILSVKEIIINLIDDTLVLFWTIFSDIQSLFQRNCDAKYLVIIIQYLVEYTCDNKMLYFEWEIDFLVKILHGC